MSDMFAFGSAKNDMVRVGERNVEACKNKLKELKISIGKLKMKVYSRKLSF